jgi:S1-C subfamily serine protease
MPAGEFFRRRQINGRLVAGNGGLKTMRLFLTALAVVVSISSAFAQNLQLAQLKGQGQGDGAQQKQLPSTRPQDDLTKSRAWVGITAIELNRAVARRRGVPGDHQVMITQLIPNGPAANGGIRVNDVILRVNGVNTLRLIDVSAAFNVVAHGAPVEVVVFRDRKEIPLTLTMIRLELAPAVNPNQPAPQQRN